MSESAAASATTKSLAPARRGFAAFLLRALRALLFGATVFYAVALLALLAGLEWWGERFWVFSLLLYAPPQIFLLPLLALLPACLLFRPRLCPWQLALAAFVLLGYMPHRWSWEPVRSAQSLTAISFNAGDSDHQQFAEFVAAEKPDVILLQDAWELAAEFSARFPGMFLAQQGEFLLLSRFPIVRSRSLDNVIWRKNPAAARFEVLIGGMPVVIYNVRMPTPRGELVRFIPNPEWVRELIEWAPMQPLFAQHRAWLRERIDLAQRLATTLAAEPEPFIVGGDFNTPDHGYIHRLFASKMTDAFPSVGRGAGLTFPATTHLRLAFSRPWLRLDYFYAGRGWRPVICRTEPGSHSEHKALLARFEPLGK